MGAIAEGLKAAGKTLGKVSAGLGAGALASTATGVGAPVGAAAGIGSAITGAASLALTLGPLIAEYFSGSGDEEAAQAKIEEARNALASRLVASEGISTEAALKAVNEQLEPLIQQHAQDSSSRGSALVGGALAAAGGVTLGRGLLRRRGAPAAVATAKPRVRGKAKAKAVPVDAPVVPPREPVAARTGMETGTGARRPPPGSRRRGFEEAPPLEAEVMEDVDYAPREPSPSPPAYMTRERINVPFDEPAQGARGFTMGDSRPIGIGYDSDKQIEREIERQVVMRRLRDMLRPGD